MAKKRSHKGTKKKAKRKVSKKKPAQRAVTSTPDIANNQRELAAAVGRTQPTIHGWIHDARWPFSKRGPWKVSDVVEWAAASIKSKTEPGERSDRLAEAELLKAESTAAREALKLEYDRGELLKRSEVRGELSSLLIRFRARLLALPRSITTDLDSSGFLVDGATHQCDDILTTAIETVLRELAEGTDGITQRRKRRKPAR